MRGKLCVDKREFTLILFHDLVALTWKTRRAIGESSSTMIHPADERLRLASLHRFDPPLERAFNDLYFERVVSTLRLAAPFMVVLLLLGLRLSVKKPAPNELALAVPQMVFWTACLALTFVRGFGRIWQPTLTLLALLTTANALWQLAPMLAKETVAASNLSGQVPTEAQQKFYFALQFVALLVPLAMLRLQFRWSVLLYGGVFAIGVWAFLHDFPLAPDVFLDIHHALLPAMLVLFPLLLTSFTQERINRTAFWAAHQLEEERNDERRKREQTEGKLHVLAQAIGGIVHDLGNPLAAVQMGSETLELFLEDEIPDKQLLGEFAHAIGDGVKMLNFLRLSLIEQTRVLEGKPTPVDLHPVSLRPLLQSGVRFQKPHVLGKRQVQLQDGDALLCADEMKMITVWMNLLGNALKYSDGDVHVRWREFNSPQGSWLLVAVADQGTGGRGISRSNAAKLFSAFGRLDVHSQIEGTGLGLLSVQKIMEAHGGEAWIEGFEDGTPATPAFSTARGRLDSMLEDDDRTAFVVSCPLLSGENTASEKEAVASG